MAASPTARIREFARVMREMTGVIPAMKYRLPDDEDQTSLGKVFEEAVAQYPTNIMLLCDDQVWTYREFNAEVNRFAAALKQCGLARGDTVALFMENRAEYVLAVLATVKLGITCSLINHSLSGNGLVHCINATDAKACIFGDERTDELDEVRAKLPFAGPEKFLWFNDERGSTKPDWATDARIAMADQSEENPATTAEIKAGEIALYIFTSGTTGLPKAAVVRHLKILGAGQGMGRIGFRIKPEDRLYLCLPIYHITGLGPGLCGFITGGASIVLRRSFSASRFWPEVQRYKANSFVYVGELCRYLAAQPSRDEERDNPLTKMLGNGLRPDIWQVFKTRFGVDRICEIYGSSEGNVSFANILNKENTIGAALTDVALVSYDIDNDEIRRDEQGLAIEVPVGEPGLLLGKISKKARFDGYSDAKASAKKVVCDVWEPGDEWFNTGDLVRQIDVGFAMGLKHFQFVDRTGDTFRWRAENVSTNEVAEALNGHPQIDMANVYGVEVPGAEGRAGMVAFSPTGDGEFDSDTLAKLVDEQLPVYARPIFVRLQAELETTGTFKLLKSTLREQAYHPDQVGNDVVLVRKPRGATYERLSEDFYQQIIDGSAGY